MPHLTIEYTNNLPEFDAQNALERFNALLADSGHFEELDIKSRAIEFNSFRIGTSNAPRAFVHVKLAILAGRTAEAKAKISQGLLEVLQRVSPWPSGVGVQLCVEIQESDRESYSKVGT
jgi:5-carboxymethyl-2-hydroxymuconate isomerase